MADQAGRRNMDPNMYLFAPIVVETSGVFGKQTLPFHKDLACHVHKVSWFSYLLQDRTVRQCCVIPGTFASVVCFVFEAYSVITSARILFIY